ncbi:uncharacterized protein F5Z01DRAFT_670476 [Emericellopsis atlantica]|uniref:Uncharacterized protein n=1 Tax=Emericellopsis atlantica TaxID=2614577 RepID=A0A9P7ZT71_9HYPO|nr:uncharacterized protein F5Z01DRAFT_670476 [Emericellopsis atlantica]KAG9257815.1 hypothetical protein F5Z01DRAFT_670476 [Emericellopsis atlantica]
MSQPPPTGLVVGPCHHQGSERFDADALRALRQRETFWRAYRMVPPSLAWPATDAYHVPVDTLGEDPLLYLVPDCQAHRNNLTALSSVYNLYFAAYQNHVFVYRPMLTAAPNLSKHPQVKIRFEPTKQGLDVGGAIDTVFRGQSLNHIIVGLLGHDEILLGCADNGDVTAYYTQDIAAHAYGESQSERSRRPLRPCFRSNVNKSAWGLAIHTKSRLIAVSTNRAEVTVLAPALHSNTAREAACTTPEDRVRARCRDWRIIVALPAQTSNLPNVTFMDDEHGNAEKICAIDINGAVFVADIWRANRGVLRIRPADGYLRQSEEEMGQSSRGWGVLALHRKHFMTVKTIQELTGLALNSICLSYPGSAAQFRRANIATALQNIPDNPSRCFVPPLPLSLDSDLSASQDESEEEEDEEEDEEEGEEEEEGESDDDEEEDDENSGIHHGTVLAEDPGPAPIPLASFITQAVENHLNETRGEMAAADAQGSLPVPRVYHPHLGAIRHEWPEGHLPDPTPDCKTGTRKAYSDPMSFVYPKEYCRELYQNNLPHDDAAHDLAHGYTILRTYEKDFELIPAVRATFGSFFDKIGLYCSDALRCEELAHEGPDTDLFMTTSRLNMLAHVPELCMVVIGSATGRVLLATLTCLANARMHPLVNHRGDSSRLKYGMRLEAVLPRKSEEARYRRHDGTKRPLHGLAVGRVPQARGGDRQAAETPLRYRIMLHYRDHTILTYEVTRHVETGMLCLF